MTQYKIYNEGTKTDLVRGDYDWRLICEDGIWKIQSNITDLGFAGVEDTDFETIETHTSPDSLGVYRNGMRTEPVLDTTLTATGFSGTENIDWENIIL